jgi:hypothetical protein
MPLLGQASGGWTESSSALRILNLGIANSIGVLTDDAFTQANPPIVAANATAQVDQTLTGVLSGSVCYARGDAGGGSNFIGGPTAVAAGQDVDVLGIFINNANGNAFENTPGTASGKGPYISGQGTYGNTLFEDTVLTGGNAGNPLTAYAVAQNLYASHNGYLTNCLLADMAAASTEQLWHQVDMFAAASAVGDPDLPTLIGVVKMVPDAVQGDLVYDQRI